MSSSLTFIGHVTLVVSITRKCGFDKMAAGKRFMAIEYHRNLLLGSSFIEHMVATKIRCLMRFPETLPMCVTLLDKIRWYGLTSKQMLS